MLLKKKKRRGERRGDRREETNKEEKKRTLILNTSYQQGAILFPTGHLPVSAVIFDYSKAGVGGMVERVLPAPNGAKSWVLLDTL